MKLWVPSINNCRCKNLSSCPLNRFDFSPRKLLLITIILYFMSSWPNVLLLCRLCHLNLKHEKEGWRKNEGIQIIQVNKPFTWPIWLFQESSLRHSFWRALNKYLFEHLPHKRCWILGLKIGFLNTFIYIYKLTF